MTLAPLGECAVRVELGPGLDPRAVLRVLRAVPGATDAVVAEGAACVYFDPRTPPALDAADLARAFAAASHELAREPRPLHVVRARYDGPDLDAVARYAGVSRDRAIELHASREYTVAMLGFLPGFAYLAGLDPRLAAPRLAVPRVRVPAGAIGVAGERTAVYPFATPGGWNLVATAVDFVAFDPARGATLALGDRVRFEPA